MKLKFNEFICCELCNESYRTDLYCYKCKEYTCIQINNDNKEWSNANCMNKGDILSCNERGKSYLKINEGDNIYSSSFREVKRK